MLFSALCSSIVYCKGLKISTDHHFPYWWRVCSKISFFIIVHCLFSENTATKTLWGEWGQDLNLCLVLNSEFAYDFHKIRYWCMNNLSDGLICKSDCQSLTVYSELNLAHQQLIEWLADKTMHSYQIISSSAAFFPHETMKIVHRLRKKKKKKLQRGEDWKKKSCSLTRFSFPYGGKVLCKAKNSMNIYWEARLPFPFCIPLSLVSLSVRISPFGRCCQCCYCQGRGGGRAAHETPDNEHMPSPQWSSCVLCVHDKSISKHLHILHIHLF